MLSVENTELVKKAAAVLVKEAVGVPEAKRIAQQSGIQHAAHQAGAPYGQAKPYDITRGASTRGIFAAQAAPKWAPGAATRPNVSASPAPGRATPAATPAPGALKPIDIKGFGPFNGKANRMAREYGTKYIDQIPRYLKNLPWQDRVRMAIGLVADPSRVGNAIGDRLKALLPAAPA